MRPKTDIRGEWYVREWSPWGVIGAQYSAGDICTCWHHTGKAGYWKHGTHGTWRCVDCLFSGPMCAPFGHHGDLWPSPELFKTDYQVVMF